MGRHLTRQQRTGLEGREKHRRDSPLGLELGEKRTRHKIMPRTLFRTVKDAMNVDSGRILSAHTAFFFSPEWAAQHRLGHKPLLRSKQ